MMIRLERDRYIRSLQPPKTCGYLKAECQRGELNWTAKSFGVFAEKGPVYGFLGIDGGAGAAVGGDAGTVGAKAGRSRLASRT